MKLGKAIIISGIWIGAGLACFAPNVGCSPIAYALIATIIFAIFAEPISTPKNKKPSA